MVAFDVVKNSPGDEVTWTVVDNDVLVPKADRSYRVVLVGDTAVEPELPAKVPTNLPDWSLMVTEVAPGTDQCSVVLPLEMVCGSAKKLFVCDPPTLIVSCARTTPVWLAKR